MIFFMRFLGLKITLALFVLALPQNEIDAQVLKRGKNKQSKINAINKTQAEKYFVEGEKYFILEDYAKAYVFFQKSLEISPDNAAAHFKIAQILIKGGDYDKALSHALKALDINPENKYYHLITAEVYTKQSNLKDAAEIYEKMLATLPGNENYLFDLAAIYLYMEEYENALKTYERSEEHFGIQEEIVLQKQKLYLELNQLENAIKEAKKLIEFFPEEPEHTRNYASVLSSNGREEEAIKVLIEHLENFPEHSGIRLMLAEQQRSMGRRQQAAENFKIVFEDPDVEIDKKIKVLSRYVSQLPDKEIEPLTMSLAEKLTIAHPDDADTYAIFGDLLYAIGKEQKAKEQYIKSANLDGSNFNVWQNILNIEVELQQYDSVIAHADQALEYFPNQGLIYYFQGFSHAIKKNNREAANALEMSKKLSSSNPELVSNINAQLGDVYNVLKQYEKSDEAYEAALSHNPNYDHVLNNYSYFLAVRKEDLEYARKMSTKLVKRNPDNPTFLDTHAWVLYMLGEYKEAKKYLEKALQGENVSGVIVEHYGDVLFKLGNIDGAVKYWEKAKGLDDSLELIDRKIADRKLYE